MRASIPGLIALVLLASVDPASATAQSVARPVTAAQPAAAPRITEEKRGLFAKAKVTGEAAMATALATVPSGRVTKGELEEEDGRLIFSFDIKVEGRRGIKEVHVDALSGLVVKAEDEDDPAPSKATPTKRP